MPSAALPRRYGDYVLLEALGQGGMSAVDLARRSVDRAGFVRFLVIKRILKKNTTDPTFVRMFMDEARINAELQHENIAQVYDFGERDGEWYLAMEYVPGIDLRRLQKSVAAQKEGGALLPPRIAFRILHDVLAALQYAHNRVDTFGRPMNIVHRDVNPRNIMVSVRGEVKLIDFGVAKADTRHDQTTGQTIKGKFTYMAPEQIESPVPVDGRADLFAVGLVLQELLTGSHPFRHLSEIQIIHRLISGRVDPMPDSPVHPDSAAVREVRNRAMATRPEDRFPDARSFQEALVRLAAPLGGMASRSEVAGFFRRAAPDIAVQITQRLEAWKHAQTPATSPPLLAVPPDADLSDDTWASDMRTAEIPKGMDPDSFGSAEPQTVADAGLPLADATVADSASASTATDFGEQSASSVVMARPPRSNTLPIVAAIVFGGGLGLAGLAVIAGVFLFSTPKTEPVVVMAPSTEPPPEVAPPPAPQEEPPAVAATTPKPEAAPPKATSATPKPRAPKKTTPEPPPKTAPTSPKQPAQPAEQPDADTPPPEQPTAEAPAPTPEPKATGFLFATSRPSGLEVLFEGKSLGRTPLRNAVVPVGTHTVTLRDTETGQTWRKTVTVNENQPSMVKVQQ